jgi:hypothetical protein
MDPSDHYVYIQCPICQEQCEMQNILLHIQQSHALMFTTWLITHYPDIDNDVVIEYLQMLLHNAYGFFDREFAQFHEYQTNTTNITNTRLNHWTHSIVHDKTDWECPICYQPWNTEQIMRRLNQCHHEFCDTCIRQWFSCHSKCPMCNYDYDSFGRNIEK